MVSMAVVAPQPSRHRGHLKATVNARSENAPPMTTPIHGSKPVRAREAGARSQVELRGAALTSITDPEITAFLGAGTRTGKLAYVSTDGRPLVTPVWFIVEGGCIVFNTFHKSAKARALARDPRTTLCTDLAGSGRPRTWRTAG